MDLDISALIREITESGPGPAQLLASTARTTYRAPSAPRKILGNSRNSQEFSRKLRNFENPQRERHPSVTESGPGPAPSAPRKSRGPPEPWALMVASCASRPGGAGDWALMVASWALHETHGRVLAAYGHVLCTHGPVLTAHGCVVVAYSRVSYFHARVLHAHSRS